MGFVAKTLRACEWRPRGLIGSANIQNNLATAIQLQLKTLLRRVQDLAGFIVKSVRLVGDPGHTHIEAVLAADGGGFFSVKMLE